MPNVFFKGFIKPRGRDFRSIYREIVLSGVRIDERLLYLKNPSGSIRVDQRVSEISLDENKLHVRP